MRTIIERACGLDVHQAVVVACLLVGKAGRKTRREVHSFATTTAGLLKLRDWLLAAEVTHVAMESTGVYWRPVHAMLEDAFTVIVGNAQRIKNVPGRKTDVKDSEWIAELLRYGLIPPSYVPPKPLRGLRDLTRFRQSLVGEHTAGRNRTLKVLEYANIKLASVASDVFGVSGRAMLEALIEGTKTPAEIACMAKGRLRRKLVALELALTGCLTDHHRFMLRQSLKGLDQVDERIAEIEQRIDEELEPYRAEHQLLMTHPGIDWAVAATMIAEHGVDMTVFGTAERLTAWAGVAPGSNESAGKHRRAGARKGNVYLKTALHCAATGAARTKGSYCREKYHRLKARRGPAKATGAIARKVQVNAFHMLSKRLPYKDLGADYLDRFNKHRVVANLARRLEHLGYTVTLERREEAA